MSSLRSDAMKWVLTIACLWSGVFDATADDKWEIVASDEWATVSVEKALYEKTGRPDFFVHVVVGNKLAGSKIGLDLSDRVNTLYPNQYEMNEQKTRGVINERRYGGLPMDDAMRERLKAEYASKTLHLIQPKGTLDYYIGFNGGGRKDFEEKIGRFCILTMDGELRFTDGRKTHVLSVRRIERMDEKVGDREVALRTPIVWKLVPDQAIVVGD